MVFASCCSLAISCTRNEIKYVQIFLAFDATLAYTFSEYFQLLQVPNIAYWDYNANSGDTGGIVDDSWVNVLWVKINWLIATVNLQPWYLGSVSLPVEDKHLESNLSSISIFYFSQAIMLCSVEKL